MPDKNTQPASQQPFQEAFPQMLSIEELAAQVIKAREQSIAAQAVATEPTITKETSRVGGAFGGALKRRIAETDTATRYANTNDHDVSLLSPISINRELFSIPGDLTYRGILLTAQEMGAVTFSPAALTRRVGAKVLQHTVGRPATDRHDRTHEVLQETLASRAAAAANVQSSLGVDQDVFAKLIAKMKSPGYAHMKGYEMDSLMAHAEGVFVDMIAAVLENHKLTTERVNSLTAGLDYLLGNDDYKKTFKYWNHMTTIGLNWNNRKIDLFNDVQVAILEEQQARQ